LRGVVKSFGACRALDNIDLEVRTGEAVALVGPSGCGKTTALKLLNGLLLPDSGSVEVAGAPLEASKLIEQRRATGYVIQEVGLLPHWTVADNVGTVLRLLGQSRAARAQRVDELLDAVDLPHSLRLKKPAELSGGQRQRVGIARALAAKPRVLLMDEPFGALDPLNRVRLRRLVQTLRQQAALTLLLVTHDLDDARAIADRVCVMRCGKLVETLPAAQLARAKDAWVREFLAPAQDQTLR
jgi:osmoprotectant transport system ATP-binding protein